MTEESNKALSAKIPTRNLDGLIEQVERLNKRAVKLGLAPLVLTTGEVIIETIHNDLGFDYTRSYTVVELTGDTPCLAGWRLLAAVTRQENGENLLRQVPGVEVPEHWRVTDTRCEHCKTNRYRKDVFILANEDGRETQVGRQCLADFLGGISPESLIAGAEILWSAADMMRDSEDDEWERGGRNSGNYGITVLDYLTVTAAVIRACGWVSKSKANEDITKEATVNSVDEVFFGQKSEETKEWIRKFAILPIQERDSEVAANALAWTQSINPSSDYLYNLAVACRQENVNTQTASLVASAIASYQATTERERVKKAERDGKPESSHVGIIGKRMILQAKLVMNRQFESTYGVTTLAKFEDESGNTLIWRASGNPEWLHELNGSFVAIKATIKNHDQYQGVPQTVISRVVMEAK